MPRSKYFLLIFLLFIYGISHAQIITTFAGNDTAGYSGDGGPATNAKLNQPYFALPFEGGVYIADKSNNCIRRINSAGVITTIAGNGSAIHSGDGGPAIAAGISSPNSLAIDIAGNLYIVEVNDNDSSWIRKVNTSGIITTFAGNGIEGYTGDGGPATTAELSVPTGIAVDRMGNVYTAELGRVRKVNTAGIITTIAGNGSGIHSGDGGLAIAAGIIRPSSVVVDSAGNLYIAEAGINSYNSWVRRVNTSGIISTIIGNGTSGFSGDGGLAVAAELNVPTGIAVDGAGNIYVADYYNNRIRKVNSVGFITTVVGNGISGNSGDGGLSTDAELSFPRGVAVDSSGNIYITDPVNNNVRKVYSDYTGVNVPTFSKEVQTLHIWPQPNNGFFSISVSSQTIEPAHIIITNLIGQKIKEVTTITNKEVVIQLDTPPGMYFVTTTTEHGSQSAKVVVR